MELPQVKEERELLLKKIYDYCIKVNWQKTKLDEFARELGTTRTNLRKLAKRYAKQTLSQEEYQKLIEQIDKIVEFERKDTKAKLTIINPILLEQKGKSTYLLWETEEEKEIVLKYIYEYCKNANWDKFKLEELAQKLGFSSAKIKELAKRYVKEYLSPEDYELLKLQINDNSISNRELNKITLTIINPILFQKLGKSTFLLWENEEEKELVLKYIFYYCDKFKFATQNIEQLSNYLGISKEKINEYYKEYAFKYLKWTKEKYHQKRNEYVQSNRSKIEPESKKIYDALLIASSIEEIIKTVNNSKLKFQTIKNGISNYVNTYHNGSQNIKETIKEKIKLYIEYEAKQRLSKNKSSQEQIIIASATLRAFVDNTKYLTVENFCKEEGIDTQTFSNYLSLIATYNYELFNLYILKITSINTKNNSNIINEIKQIIIYIKFGIEENSIIRPFDIIDYFFAIKIPLDDILEIVKGKITNEEYILLRSFVFENKDATKSDTSIENEISEDKEKNKIISFLKTNNIPINSKTYNIAYRRYINGTLDLNLANKLK